MIGYGASARPERAAAPADEPLPLALIEERIVDAALAPPCRLSLASGLAGVLVMAARMAQLDPSPARADRVARLAGAIVDGLGERPLQAGLGSGVAGVLYALEYARSVDPLLLGEHGEAIGQFVDEMDEVLADYLRHPSRQRHFDLISGHCGIGAYALMRTDAGAARMLFAHAEQALRAAAERHRGGCAWRGQPDAQALDEFDLGVAHGVPGVIGMLAHAIRLGLHTQHTAGLLDDSVRWLLQQQDQALAHSRFASFTGMRGKSSRLAWCYGDLGIGAMLATAAQARHDAALTEWWQALVRWRLAQPLESWQLADDALCHGRAGVAHILQRLLAHGLDPAPAAALLRQLRQDLSRSIIAASDGMGLIEGWSGVLLVLAEARHDAGASTRPWHLCMLTPA